MTDQEKIKALKQIVGNDYTDELLSTYLSIAGQKIIARAFPYDNDKKEVPLQYDYLQIEISAYLVNKRGAEGETAHSENGISRTYENADVPNSMLREIVPFCGVI